MNQPTAAGLSTTGDRIESKRDGSNARYALLLLFLINTVNFYDRQVLAAVSEPIRIEFGLRDTALGLLNTAFILMYAVVGLPAGRWADRGNRPTLLGTGLATWSLFSGAAAAAWSYASLAVSRIGVGVGEATCAPAANSIIGDLFPAHRRARALSVFMLGLPVGVMLANVISGIVAKAYGWRATFLVAAIPGLILAVLVTRLVDPPRGAADVSRAATHDDRGFWPNLLLLLRIPTLRWIVITGALHNFNAYAVNAFMPAYLGRYHGLDLRQANVVTGFMLGGIGIVTLLVAGIAADRAHRWRPSGRLLLGALAIGVATPSVYIALLQPPGRVAPFIAWMGIAWGCSYVYYATVYASVHDVVPPALRGSAMSLYFFCMYVLGGAFGTTLLGMLSDGMARRAMTAAGSVAMSEVFRATGLHEAFSVVPVVFALLTLSLLAASRTVTRDMNAVRDPGWQSSSPRDKLQS